MKKAFKIVGITLASLILLLVIVISGGIWFVFTPERITPIVQEQLDKNLLCKSQLDRVELTFFSSFPHFSLRIDGLKLLNSIDGAAADTLLSVNEVFLQVDIDKLLKKNELEIQGASLIAPRILLFTDSLGRNNYTIVAPDTTTQDTSAFQNPFNLIALKRLDLKDATIRYIDRQTATDVTLAGITTEVVGGLNGQEVDALLKCSVHEVSAQYDTTLFVVRKPLDLTLSFKASMDTQSAELREMTFSSLSVKLDTKGSFKLDSTQKESYLVNQDFVLSVGDLNDLIALVPPAYESMIKGIAVSGAATFSGKANGVFNSKIMPIVSGKLDIANVGVDMDEYPAYSVIGMNLKGELLVDLNSQTTSFLKIETANAKAFNSTFEFRGLADQFFTDPRFQGDINAQLNLTTLGKEFMEPEGYFVQGKAQTRFHLVTTLSQAQNADLSKIKVGGMINLTDFTARSPKDTLFVQTKKSEISFATNVKKEGTDPNFFKGDIYLSDLFLQQGNSTKAELSKIKLNLLTDDVRDTSRISKIKCTYEAEYVDARMDTMSGKLRNLKGKLAMGAAKKGSKYPYYIIEAKAESVSARMGSDYALIDLLDTQFTLLDVNTEKEPMLRWIPKGSVRLNNANITTAMVQYPVSIPTISLDFRPNHYTINSSRLIIGNSDFELSGELTDVYRYFKQKAPLKGDFTFVSKMTDLNQLMSMTSGQPSEETTATPPSVKADTVAVNSSPYMVPLNIDLTLKTKVLKARINDTDLSDISGKLVVRDGRLIMDSMSLTSPGGRMVITSMYRTPRKNHLYAGINLRLLDVQIKELLEMVPDIDTIMPMLRSFGGSGEFVMSAETYMDSLYNIKMSTLLGAASITGKDLVLMDGETFSEIAKMLRFNKKTTNRIDSLSAEFTVERNEVDIFPFQIVMDKYKAVIDGTHNLDMSFKYHISVTDCPLPIRLGLDVWGTLEKPKFALAECKYKNLYKPARRNEVDKRALNLKKILLESLNKPKSSTQ